MRVRRLEGYLFEAKEEYSKAQAVYDEILKEDPTNAVRFTANQRHFAANRRHFTARQLPLCMPFGRRFPKVSTPAMSMWAATWPSPLLFPASSPQSQRRRTHWTAALPTDP